MNLYFLRDSSRSSLLSKNGSHLSWMDHTYSKNGNHTVFRLENSTVIHLVTKPKVIINTYYIKMHGGVISLVILYHQRLGRHCDTTDFYSAALGIDVHVAELKHHELFQLFFFLFPSLSCIRPNQLLNLIWTIFAFTVNVKSKGNR